MPNASTLIWLAGFGQLSVLIASSLVPLRLNWRNELRGLKRLHRQMYWTYGGYVVLSIIAFGVICLACPEELASGSRLARTMCCYMTAFWGIRLSLQTVFDVREHLTTWWLRLGYHTLTVLFCFFTFVFGYSAIQ